jgi:hypothetical protein
VQNGSPTGSAGTSFAGSASATYYLSPGWLQIDPTFIALGNPRFDRLVVGG